MLLPLSRKTELFHAVAHAHSNHENTFNLIRDRHGVAGKDLTGELARPGVPPQRLRAWAGLMLDWFRLNLRHGWVTSVGLEVRQNGAMPERLSGRHDPLTGEVVEVGVGTEGLGRLLRERKDAGLALPYGSAWRRLQERVASNDVGSTAARSTRRTLARHALPEQSDPPTFPAPIVLLDIVREVARLAARRDLDPFKGPETVTQSAWNSARHLLAAEFDLPPLAHEVCRQLCDHEGKPWPWHDLLKAVLDPHGDPRKAWAERLSKPEDAITEGHVQFAINFVTCRLGTRRPENPGLWVPETRPRP